jgi:hypothetical protein
MREAIYTLDRTHTAFFSCPYSPKCVERLYEKWFSEGISLL